MTDMISWEDCIKMIVGDEPNDFKIIHETTNSIMLQRNDLNRLVTIPRQASLDNKTVHLVMLQAEKLSKLFKWRYPESFKNLRFLDIEMRYWKVYRNIDRRIRLQNCPKTVEETVNRLLGILSEEDKAYIKNLTLASVSGHLHFSLGLYIRNEYIHIGCDELMKDCARIYSLKHSFRNSGYLDPDDCSGVIVDALWERLQQIE